MSNWYVGRNKRKLGPFSFTQLQQLAALGMIEPTEHVLQEGADRWAVASSVAGLFATADGPQQYWLFLGGKGQGPYPADRIQVDLMRRQLPPETLACAVGGKEWVALGQLEEFRACVPSAPRSSHAQLGPDSSRVDLSEEESRLYLAGKQGDLIARLICSLLDMKRKYHDDPSLVALLDRNIHDLKVIRGQGATDVGPTVTCSGG